MLRGILAVRSVNDFNVIQTAAFSRDFLRCKSEGTRYLLTYTNT